MKSPEEILSTKFGSKQMTSRQLSAAINTAKEHSQQYVDLLRETVVRAKLDLPVTETECDWFEQGTDHKKCGDFMNRLFNALDKK